MKEALKESLLADAEYWMIPITQQEQKKKSTSFSSHFPPPSTQTCLNKQKIHKGITWYAQGRQVRRKTWPGICIPSTEAAHTTAHRHHLPAGCVHAGKCNGIKAVNHDIHKDITRS